MELLLNLIWLTLAVGAFIAFARGQRSSARMTQVAYCRSLVALACVAVLLFPIVSASDDLHPTQAVMEDASKRVQLAVAPLHLLRTSTLPPMVPAMLMLVLMCALVILLPWRQLAAAKVALDGVLVASAGRAPPFCRL